MKDEDNIHERLIAFIGILCTSMEMDKLWKCYYIVFLNAILNVYGVST